MIHQIVSYLKGRHALQQAGSAPVVPQMTIGIPAWQARLANFSPDPVFYCSECKVLRFLSEKSIENQVMEKLTSKDDTIIDFCPVCKKKTIHRHRESLY